jgi:hypothetical protein
VPSSVDFDIGGLEIAMNDALLVRGLECLGNLLRNRERFVDGDRTARDPVCERRALDELHDQGATATSFFEAVDLRDLRVVQRRQCLGFALEAGDPVSIMRKGIVQNLDRDLAAKVGIARTVDVAHAALANRGHHFVDSEASSWRQRHGESKRAAIVPPWNSEA